jgi:pimeloyl-ACP methyl ester carboxylesterase
MGGMVDDAGAIIEQLSPGVKPIVFGHSMGGNNLLGLLSERPLASRAVIVDTGPEIAPEGSQRIGAFVQSAQEWDSVDDYVEKVSAYDTFRSKEHIRRTMKYNIMERADGKLVTKQFPRERRVESRNPRGRLSYEGVAKIDIPLLITRGEQSNVLLEEPAKKFVSVLPQGKLVTIPNCGHNVHSQNTPGFLAEVRPFIGLS